MSFDVNADIRKAIKDAKKKRKKQKPEVIIPPPKEKKWATAETVVPHWKMGNVNTVVPTYVFKEKKYVKDAATDSAAKTTQIYQQEDVRSEKKLESTSNLL